MKKTLFIIAIMLFIIVMPYVLLAEQIFIGESEHLLFFVDDANGNVIIQSGYSKSIIKHPDKVSALFEEVLNCFNLANGNYTKQLGCQDGLSIWFTSRRKRQFATVYIIDSVYGWCSYAFINNKQEIDIIIELLKRSTHISQEIKKQKLKVVQ